MDTQDYEISSGFNPTGLARRIFIQEIKKFTDIKEPAASPATQADALKIVGDHTFAGTTGWRELFVHENTPELDGENVGEDGSPTRTYKVMAFHPNWNPALEAETSVDKSYIVLVERVCVNSGKYFQLGTKCLGAKITSVLKSGKTREGGRFGHEIEIEATQVGLYEYAGVVTPDTTE